QGGICNNRTDTGRLICWRCILFSAEYRLYLGKDCRENASAKFGRREIPLFSCCNGNIVGRRRSFRFSVGLKLLKNKLSEYVRLAAGGETVLVTDRDRVVAEIVPPRPGRSPLLVDALLAEAVREGWLTPPTQLRIHDGVDHNGAARCG